MSRDIVGKWMRIRVWYVRPANPQISLRSAQSDQSLCLSLEYSMNVKLVTEQHFEFLSLKGGCTGSSQSTIIKMPHYWKSHYYKCNVRICLVPDHLENLAFKPSE